MSVALQSLEMGPPGEAELARLRACAAFLIDMDGTLYVGEQLIAGADEFVASLRRDGRRYLFLTNNSSRPGDDYRRRLERLGIAATRADVLTSGDATIEHLLGATPHRSACLLGTPALEDEFRCAGIAVDLPDPDCVVVAFDTTLTYAKLERACTLLFAGKPYYATHGDRTCITERGLIPDAAALIAACEAVTGRLPEIVGKPHAAIVAAALGRLGVSVERTAIIGDQLDTDMAMARRCGACAVLVLSGETTPEQLAAQPPAARPALVARDAAQVAEWLQR
jgi:HAD superfamily hydrolase (TIGR01450 family)